jgi:hypothetical protein
LLVIASVVEAPCLEPLFTNTHAARAFTAAVPPVVLFVFTQVFVAPLKSSFISTAAVFEFEVADEVRFTDPPEQTELTLADAITDVGTGFTTKVLVAVLVPQEPPEVVNVSVTVPV